MKTEQLFITFTAIALCLSSILAVSCTKKDGETHRSTVKLNAQKDTVEVGKTVELTATVEPSEGATAVWKSGNEKIATVKGSAFKGTVTGVGEGKTYIYCIVNEFFEDSCEVTVRQHIYPEAPDSACVCINGIWWAPVNCGYDAKNYPYGKLYQTGRKDGCGYIASDKTTTEFNDADSIQTTVKGPIDAQYEKSNEFYTSVGEYPQDWLLEQDSTRWNSNKEWPGRETNPVKNAKYDPCPSGWRVPTITELYSLTGGKEIENISIQTHNGQKGHWFDGTNKDASTGIFLPAAGLRGPDNGTGARGVAGLYSSSSAASSSYDKSIGAYIFSIELNDYTQKVTIGEAPCAGARSVRCVLDE